MFKNIESCLCCGEKRLSNILDLGSQPLANSYPLDLNEKEAYYPLMLNLCNHCFHLQLSISVNPNLLFKNYLYLSGTTQTLKKYFDDFANITLGYMPSAQNVLDIACNDGSQLNSYKKLGLKTFGVDPAENLHSISLSNGHQVFCDYFTPSLSKKINNTFDIIIAQNVFAHNSNPSEFLQAASTLMDKKSIMFIQTSQSNMIMNNEFDTIYHEHISFFNTLSAKTIIENNGLYLIDVFKTNIHGSSYVFVVSREPKTSKTVDDQILVEKNLGLYSNDTYIRYAQQCYTIANEFNQYITDCRAKGYKCIGYGAAAKGTVMLNFSQTVLDFVIEDNPLKVGKFIPGMKIPIFNIDRLDNIDPNKCIIIPLAWNFFTEIKDRVSQRIKNIQYVKYFPSLFIEQY